jgi:hypothetical protein
MTADFGVLEETPTTYRERRKLSPEHDASRDALHLDTRNNMVDYNLLVDEASEVAMAKEAVLQRRRFAMPTQRFAFYFMVLVALTPLWVMLRATFGLSYEATAAILLPVLTVISVMWSFLPNRRI